MDGWLATSFSPTRITQTVEAMVAAQETAEVEPRARAARARISEAATKMARCRTALEAGGDPEEINQWIAETKAERLRAEAELRRWEGRPQMTKEQITAMIDGLGDLAEALKEADPERKAEVYQGLGLRLTYHPGERKVRAEAHLDPHRLIRRLQPEHIVKRFVSEG